MDEERTPLSDIIVGCSLMAISAACGIAYSIILTTIWKDGELMKMISYKFMFVLGIFDVIQCFPHFMTGIFTVYRQSYSPGLAKAMGVLATPAYVAYTVLTVFLAFSRFVQLYSSRLDEMLFGGSALRVWIAIALAAWFLFALALASPWASIIYLPDYYSWDYDYDLRFSLYVQKTEMVIELSTILISAVFYLLVIIALYRTRKRFATQSNAKAEIKILIQALVITVYCTVLNFLWHNYQLVLPSNLWSYTALNFMWVANAGVYPLIYFIVNRAIRDRIAVRKSAIPTVSIFTRVVKSGHRSSTNLVEVTPPKCKIIRTHFNGETHIGSTVKSNRKVKFVS
ncbi:unnamed protein product [Cylicocyclus nassatus]|uniref:Uncharacterized protein n=1 Tax=Cylicocyclus nassatus TaxID=53992 RepID=A0AA36M235_CYLNA|nr:unnamed protein product [Cylicocyclus nassatus]